MWDLYQNLIHSFHTCRNKTIQIQHVLNFGTTVHLHQVHFLPSSHHLCQWPMTTISHLILFSFCFVFSSFANPMVTTTIDNRADNDCINDRANSSSLQSNEQKWGCKVCPHLFSIHSVFYLLTQPTDHSASLHIMHPPCSSAWAPTMAHPPLSDMTRRVKTVQIWWHHCWLWRC
jgi:hypothetical protein